MLKHSGDRTQNDQSPSKKCPTRDPNARNALVEKNEPLVHAIVGKYLGREHPDYHDVAGAGIVALIEAIDTFDPSRGTLRERLSTRVNTAVCRALPRGYELRASATRAPYEVRDLMGSCESLTAREREVLIMRMDGTTIDEISEQLAIGRSTVRRAIKSATEKLQAEAEKALVLVIPSEKSKPDAPQEPQAPSWRRTNTDLESELAFAAAGYRCPLGRITTDESAAAWAIVKAGEMNDTQWGIVAADDAGFGADNLGTELGWPETGGARLRSYLHGQALCYRTVDLADPPKKRRCALIRKGIIDDEGKVLPFGRAIQAEVARIELKRGREAMAA